MKLLEVVKQLTKKPARNPVLRRSTNRARPYLEALESRMAPSDITGGTVTSDPTPSPQQPVQNG
jgi:hypothetical protein